jgi:hypothetical protein
VAAIGRHLMEAISPLATFEVPAVPVETGLFEFARRMAMLAVQPEPLSVFRTLALEGGRFPNLAKLFIERNRERAIGLILRVLQAYEQRGDLVLSDAQMTAEHFFILMVGIPQRMAMLGLGRLLLHAEHGHARREGGDARGRAAPARSRRTLPRGMRGPQGGDAVSAVTLREARSRQPGAHLLTGPGSHAR